MPLLRELHKRMGLVLAASPLLFAGCSQLHRQTPVHDSAGLLDSEPVSKVSKRQAADVEVALGRSLEASGNLAEAESTYRDALKKNPKRADAEERLAILADQRGATKEAAQHFARALKLDPKNPEILCDLGYSYYLQRRWSDAEDYLKRAISLQPRHARSHTNLGLVLARQGDKAGALAEFARAGCDAADAQANLGLVLAMEGHFEDAKQAYGAALAAKPALPAAQEGMRATMVAMAGGKPGQPTAIAGTAGSKGRLDPGLARTSAVSPAQPSR